MTDIFDLASAQEQAFRDAVLSGQDRRAGLRGKSFLDSARNCRVCDETLPLARRQAVPGVQTCLACQEDLEAAVTARGFVGRVSTRQAAPDVREFVGRVSTRQAAPVGLKPDLQSPSTQAK